MTEIARMDELKQELEELRALVNTLLTIIMEEACLLYTSQSTRDHSTSRMPSYA